MSKSNHPPLQVKDTKRIPIPLSNIILDYYFQWKLNYHIYKNIALFQFFINNVLSTLANAMLAAFVLKKGRMAWAVLIRHFVWRTKICTYQNFSLPHFLKSLSCNI